MYIGIVLKFLIYPIISFYYTVFLINSHIDTPGWVYIHIVPPIPYLPYY